MVKSRYIGDGHPTFNRNPYNGYISPYYWVDDHPLLYGNIGSLDPSTYEVIMFMTQSITWIVAIGKPVPYLTTLLHYAMPVSFN